LIQNEETKTTATCTKCKLTMKHLTTEAHGGTGQLRTHLRKCNKEFARIDDMERANRKGISIPENSIGVEGSNMIQSVLNMTNPAGPRTHRTYSKGKDRREITKMVVVCGLPFFISFTSWFYSLYSEIVKPKI